MNSTGTIGRLIRHELTWKGSWAHAKRGAMGAFWRLIYGIAVLLVISGVFAYQAVRDAGNPTFIWYFTLGYPYMMVFLGLRTIKKEWDNDTYGWWLTMPLSHLKMIGAKWVASWIWAIAAIVAVFVLGTLWMLAVSSFVPSYSAAEVVRFMEAGSGWLLLIAGFSPLMVSLGIMLGAWRYSVLRPATPILWVIVMGGTSLLYSANVDSLLSLASESRGWFPYSWPLVAGMAAGWAATWGILRLTAYLLERKLSL